MGTTAQFDLDTAVAAWRHFLSRQRRFIEEDLDELEIHLRDEVDALLGDGIAPEEAFAAALRRVGDYATIDTAYSQAYWPKVRGERRLGQELIHRLSMLKSYLVSALRNVRRHPYYALVNLIGMAVGLACVLLVAVYVQHELTYDRFLPGASRIYRVAQEQPGNVFMGTNKFAVTPAGVSGLLRNDVPGVAAATTFRQSRYLIRRPGGAAFEEHGIAADSFFFDVLPFELLRGDPKAALARPASIVLTASLAEKLFGDRDPLGETLDLEGDTYTVTAVAADVPSNSNIPFTFIAPIYSDSYTQQLDRWGSSSYNTFFKMEANGSISRAEYSIQNAIQAKRAATDDDGGGPPPRFYTESLSSVHFDTDINFDIAAKGNLQYVYLYGAIALIILLLACANYTNLSTARALRRTREIGVRKAVGARRGQLTIQFLGEAVLTAFGALVLAVVAVALLLPAFGSLLSRDLVPRTLVSPVVLSILLVALLVASLGAGLYPAFIAGRMRPSVVLKGDGGISIGGRRLRDVLVAGQYAAAIALTIATVIIWQQMHFVRSAHQGVDRDHVVTIQLNGVGDRAAFEAELANVPGVAAVTATSHLPINVSSSTSIEDWEGSEAGDKLTIYFLAVDPGFFDVFHVPLVEGTPPPAAFADDAPPQYFLNETAARALGWDTAIGKNLPGGDPRPVAGVVADFHMHSMHLPIAPLMIQVSASGNQPYLSLRLGTKDVSGVLHHIEQAWGQFSSYPFKYQFMDDAFDNLYRSELRLEQGFQYFTLLALLLASLGLFGISALMMEQRIKEVGIRKVLGAKVPGLLVLLAKEFVVLVLIAMVVAAPVAYYVMRQWLADFAYRIDLSPLVFALVGVGAVVIAFVTVSVQSLRAARASPVHLLRHE